ncbi:hypothetical protein ACSJLX_002557 [Serratia marcescens]|nr:hypothetical protein C2M07_07955 [Serratia marcescens]PNU50701.1 hypothetical protein C2M03_00665 [Serratia marcescens]
MDRLGRRIISAWLVYKTVDSVRALREVTRQNWVTVHDTVWYWAAFNGRKGAVVALDRLLAW